VSRS